MTDWSGVLVAVLTVAGGSLVGLAALVTALRKAGPEADKSGAEATAALLGASKEVVALLRQQMDEQAERLAVTDSRVEALEATVMAWDGWADRVLDILDRAVGMLSEEQRAALRPDIEHARETRPVKHHHRKHLVHPKEAP